VFDPNVDVDEYSFDNLKKLAKDIDLPGRSSFKRKADLYDELKRYTAEQEEERRVNEVKFAATGGHDLESMKFSELKQLAGVDGLNIANRSHAKSKEALVKLIEDYYAGGHHLEKPRTAPSNLKAFDPTFPVSAYTKAQMYELGKAANLPVTKSMNTDQLYSILERGETEEERIARQKRRSATRRATNEEGLNGMLLADLKEEARNRGLTGYSRMSRGDLIQAIQEYDSKHPKKGPSSPQSKKSSPPKPQPKAPVFRTPTPSPPKRNVLRSSGTLLPGGRPLPKYININTDDDIAELLGLLTLSENKPKPPPARQETSIPPNITHFIHDETSVRVEDVPAYIQLYYTGGDNVQDVYPSDVLDNTTKNVFDRIDAIMSYADSIDMDDTSDFDKILSVYNKQIVSNGMSPETLGDLMTNPDIIEDLSENNENIIIDAFSAIPDDSYPSLFTNDPSTTTDNKSILRIALYVLYMLNGRMNQAQSETEAPRPSSPPRRNNRGSRPSSPSYSDEDVPEPDMNDLLS